MGRPLNKRYFGKLADADGGTMPQGDSFYNLTINVQVGTNSESATGYILRQRSVNKFLVNDKKDGDNASVADAVADAAANGGNTTEGNVGVCTLVDKADGALGANEMSIMGQLSDGSQIRIKKFYNRTCRDFNDNKYTWEIQDDSTTTLLVLTAI
jgi:hypothetical protein